MVIRAEVQTPRSGPYAMRAKQPRETYTREDLSMSTKPSNYPDNYIWREPPRGYVKLLNEGSDLQPHHEAEWFGAFRNTRSILRSLAFLLRRVLPKSLP